MKKTFIAVRDVDEETFRKFRAQTIEERMKLGDALTIAMKHWLQEVKAKTARQKILRKDTIKPFDWGKGTEKTSEEVDEILYGSKR